MIIGWDTIYGTAVTPRVKNGFGFDFVCQPDGHSRTYAEMSPDEKDAISHRSTALRDLIKKLKTEL